MEDLPKTKISILVNVLKRLKNNYIKLNWRRRRKEKLNWLVKKLTFKILIFWERFLREVISERYSFCNNIPGNVGLTGHSLHTEHLY